MSAVETYDIQLLKPILVCPLCKGGLDFSGAVISCAACDLQFPQPEDGYFDLFPRHLLEDKENGWADRQREMEGWYRDLISDPGHAQECLSYDYAPYASILSTLSGSVIDIGGGNGIVRHFLPENTWYVVLEPSYSWLEAGWSLIAERFPCLRTRPYFVRGVGECLPFSQESFDVALSFWSLNHVNRPAEVFREVRRVLRQGGRFLIVLEDMEPGWRDISGPGFRSRGVSQLAGAALRKLQCSIGIGTWPLQNDHIRIRESDILGRGSTGFDIIRRAWVGQYLAFELRKN